MRLERQAEQRQEQLDAVRVAGERVAVEADGAGGAVMVGFLGFVTTGR